MRRPPAPSPPRHRRHRRAMVRDVLGRGIGGGRVMGRRQDEQTMRNLPPNWFDLFRPVPEARSGKLRCLLCGRTGYPSYPLRDTTTFDGRVMKARPHGWQLACIRGHFARCEVCRRPFTNGTALKGHQTCKLHHDCCRDHTTVPEWKNPFRTVAQTFDTTGETVRIAGTIKSGPAVRKHWDSGPSHDAQIKETS